MKKKLIVESDGMVYSIVKASNGPNDTVAKLFYSKDCGRWSDRVRGKLAGSAHSDGNGVSLQLHGKEIAYLDYCQLEEVRYLLNEISTNPEPQVFKKVKK